MTEEMIVELTRETVIAATLLSAPSLLTVLVVGVVVNLLQTVTQIRDPALAFVPKCGGVMIVLLLSAPWHLQILRQYTEMVFGLMSQALQ